MTRVAPPLASFLYCSRSSQQPRRRPGRLGGPQMAPSLGVVCLFNKTCCHRYMTDVMEPLEPFHSGHTLPLCFTRWSFQGSSLGFLRLRQELEGIRINNSFIYFSKNAKQTGRRSKARNRPVINVESKTIEELA